MKHRILAFATVALLAACSETHAPTQATAGDTVQGVGHSLAAVTASDFGTLTPNIFAANAISPNTSSCTVGSTCSVDVGMWVGSGAYGGTYGIDFKVSFDPTVLQAISVTTASGSPYQNSPAIGDGHTSPANSIDNSVGVVFYSAMSHPGGGFNGGSPFAVATIVFKAIGAGSSALGLRPNQWLNAYGPYGNGGLATSGTVTVTGAAPIPPMPFSRNTATGEQFAPYSATFTPTQTGNYTLGFNLTAGGPSGDNSILIDAVTVTNGATTVFSDGFETGLSPNSGVSANGGSATFGAWAFSNYSGILNGSPPNWGLAGPASIGGGSGAFTLASADGTHQYAYLQAVAGTLGAMKAVNTLALVAGQTYTVSFYQASRYDFGGTTSYNVTLDYVPPVQSPTTTAVTFGSGPFVFTGSPFTATATVSSGGTASIAYTGDCTNAGTSCIATATYAGDATHASSTGTANLTITQAPSTTTVSFGAGPFVYKGSAFAATATVSPAGAASIAYTGDCTNAGNSCTATATYAGDANHTGSTSATASITIAKASSSTAVSFGAGPFVYKGSAFTATATVTPSGTAAITYAGDCVNGGTTCAATATYAGDANHNGSSASASITITYAICAVGGEDDNSEDRYGLESGSTLPAQIRVCGATGKNVGSRSLAVKAVGVSPTGSLNDSGKSNPGMLFRFEDDKYQFNLSLKGFAAGSYTLDYTIGNDPTVYHYAFSIRAQASKGAGSDGNDSKKP